MNLSGHPANCNAINGYRDELNRDTGWHKIPNSDYGWIEAIEPTPYNWSIMPDELNDTSGDLEINEVAKLIYHCGVSVKMNYGPSCSSAYGEDIPAALAECFCYHSGMQLVRRQKYLSDAWENLIKVELDMGRPVLYMSDGSKGGHGFVCDGYQDNGYFHFNWGWGGAHDAYYQLDELNPGAHKFLDSHRAIIGIYPEILVTDPCENIISIDGSAPTHTQTYRGGGSGYYSESTCGWSTPGGEQIFSFIPTRSGVFSLVATEVDGYIDCAWKEGESKLLLFNG